MMDTEGEVWVKESGPLYFSPFKQTNAMASIAKSPRVLKEEARVQVLVGHKWVTVEDLDNCEAQFDRLLSYEDLVILQEFLMMNSYPFGETLRRKRLNIDVDVAEQD